MDITQALQEIQRLREMVERGELPRTAFTQAVNKLQITDAAGAAWHVSGATLRWFRFNGQTWVEAAPPLPLAPPIPPPAPGAGWMPAPSPYQAPAVPRGSRLPLWIGLGTLAVLVIAAAAALLSGTFQAGNPGSPVLNATLVVPATASPTPSQKPPTPSAVPTATPNKTALAQASASVPPVTPTRPSPSPTLPSAADYLPASGPWLLSKDQDNLYLIQAKKTIPLNTDKLIASGSLAALTAPKGGHVAFITATDPGRMRGLKLNIYNLAAQKMERVIALTSAKTEPGPNNLPGDPVFEAVRSITDFTSLAWSPDGRQLAFIGVQDGPSSDLYLYGLDSQKVTRLTDGPSQAFSPSWSPDGKYIVQFGASGFGTGAGIGMLGAWATRAEDASSIELYKPQSSGEIVLGWANAHTFLVYGFSPACGLYNLRAVDIQPLKVTPVFSGCFNAADYDPASASILLGISQGQADLCSCGTKVDGGLYLLKLDGSLNRFDPSDYFHVAWLKNASTAWGSAENKGGLAFTPAGKAIALPAGLPGGAPLVAPGGKAWVWTASASAKQPGLWIGSPESGAPRVSALPVSSAVWTANGSALLFLSDANLYAARGPAYQPVVLVGTFAASEIGWAAP